MMKVIITGATGFLGYAIISEMLRNGHNVTAVVRPSSSNRRRLEVYHGISIIECDLSRHEQWLPLTGTADVFIHLAWDGVRGAERQDEQRQQANIGSCLRAVDAAARLGARCFIGAGSQAEYGNAEGRINEKTPTLPDVAYGRAKLQAGAACQQRCSELGLRFVWPRIFSLYGPFDYVDSLIMSCIDKMRDGKDVELTDCNRSWDYLYADDAAAAYRMLAEADTASRVYCLASGCCQPLRYYVEAIKQLLNSTGTLHYGAICRPKTDMCSMDVDISRISKDTGWHPTTSFEQGIKKLIKMS